MRKYSLNEALPFLLVGYSAVSSAPEPLLLRRQTRSEFAASKKEMPELIAPLLVLETPQSTIMSPSLERLEGILWTIRINIALWRSKQ